MRYCYVALMAFALLLAVPFQAQTEETRGNLHNIKKPLLLNKGTNKRMHVVFNHSSHEGISCVTCHHEGLPDDRYASCASEECHSIKGPRERDVMSLFMAYHSLESERSCLGCHRQMLADAGPEYSGCRPCHMSPKAKEELAKAAN